MVLELPSGSSFLGGESPVELALTELREETGMRLGAERLRALGGRQLASTVLSHQAQLFSVELTEGEMAWLREREGVPQGEEGASERTYVKILRLGDLLAHPGVDWSTVGMILSAL
jgi:hypothetical protein